LSPATVVGDQADGDGPVGSPTKYDIAVEHRADDRQQKCGGKEDAAGDVDRHYPQQRR